MCIDYRSGKSHQISEAYRPEGEAEADGWGSWQCLQDGHLFVLHPIEYHVSVCSKERQEGKNAVCAIVSILIVKSECQITYPLSSPSMYDIRVKSALSL